VRQTKIRIPAVLAALSLAVFAPGASAATEVDAGDLPATAQNLAGEGVDQIDGALATNGDIDMYRLCLAGGRTFSATTVGGTEVDTQLFLFDSNGRGVYMNDDADPNGVFQSTLPAGHALTPNVQGEYFLAIGAYNIDPLSSSGLIFTSEPGVLGPDGAGGSNPLTMWGGRAATHGVYTIRLTGADCRAADTTPPTIDLRSPVDGAELEVGDSVQVDFSCEDEGGSGLESCVGTVPDGAFLDTSKPGPASVSVTARDNAGNETSVTHTVNVVRPDTSAPSIEILSPSDGAEYLLGEDVQAEYSCKDEEGGSGVKTCDGPIASGDFLDTSLVGPHEFTVTSTDEAGNSSSVTSRYRVVFDFVGFLWPVKNRPEVNEWHAGVPVPIRFELGGNQGLDVVEDGWPQVAVVSCDFTEEPESGESARHPRWFRELVYKKRKQRYLFLWKTDKSWAGSCRQFMLKLKDGTIARADFEFVRHGHGDDDDH
jgi:hypothetical protein